MLGPRIAALRKARGFSQAELAQKLKISSSAVGMYEQGRREPSADMLVALAELFGVSTDYLLTGKCRDAGEETVFLESLMQSVAGAQVQLDKRKNRPFSRQELAVLMAAMLMEP